MVGSGGGRRRSGKIKRGKKEGERESRRVWWEETESDKEKEGYRESRIPQVYKLVHLERQAMFLSSNLHVSSPK